MLSLTARFFNKIKNGLQAVFFFDCLATGDTLNYNECIVLIEKLKMTVPF